MGKREARIEQALVKRVTEIGGVIRKSMWISRRGCPDRRAMLPRPWRIYLATLTGDIPQNPWVECKATGEELEDHQTREINRMEGMGELVLVIDTLDQIDHFFPRSIP